MIYLNGTTVFSVKIGELFFERSLTANILSNIGLMHWYIGQNLASALDYHFKALAIRQKIMGKEHIVLTKSYNNIAICYSDMKIFDKSIEFHLKAITIQEKWEQHEMLVESYHNMAACYEESGNMDSALHFHTKGLTISKNVLGEQNLYTIASYNMLAAHFHKIRRNYSQALIYYQKSLENNFCKIAQSTDTAHMPIDDQSVSIGTVHLLNTLKLKASCLYAYFKQTGNPIHILQADITYHQAHEIISRLRMSFKIKESQLIMSRKNQSIYKEAIEVAIEIALWCENTDRGLMQAVFEKVQENNSTIRLPLSPTNYYCQAWDYAENCKALVLFSNMRDAQAKLSAKIPKKLLEKEHHLQKELTDLEKRIKEKKYKESSKENETQILQWQNQFFDCKQQYDSLIAQFEKEYPKYHQLKYNLQTIGVSAIQEKLRDNTALLNYTVCKQHYFIFIVTKNNFTVHAFEKPENFEGLIQNMCLMVKQTTPNPSHFAKVAQELYELLLGSIVVQIRTCKSLIIISDAILSKLPFEALVTQAPTQPLSYNKLDYLLHYYNIQYHFSATLWAKSDEFQTNNDFPTKDFLGFAPVYTTKSKKEISSDGVLRSVKIGETTYKELKYSETEVTQVANLFQNAGYTTLSCLHTEATLQHLEKHISHFRYVLLSTHADYDDQKPDLTGIICSPFSETTTSKEQDKDLLDEFDLTDQYVLYMPDVYHLQLNADLVVLSCCESGIGKMEEGEGMMALNRGFLYAGAKNVIYTLFKVYDKQSSKLTHHLFKGIVAQGLPYNEALRQAKLQLIDKGYFPVHWAGFVLLGA